LSDENELTIYEYRPWVAKFEWFLPFNDRKEVETSVKLPDDYYFFITQISNGAILFYDIEYGQWGFKIYSIEELDERQQFWQLGFPNNMWGNRLIAFAESYGDANVLAFDLDHPTRNGENFAILEGCIDPFEKWPIVSRSFHEWLDHLVTAQGAKYWNWF
jgi:hypothetical protein